MIQTPDRSTAGSRKKRFVLLFDDLQSIHLFKDVGQIPFQMFRHFGYDAEIFCRRSDEQYLYIGDILSGLKITFYDGDPYRCLLRHASTIDVLMLFHISTRTIYRGLLYKFLNPQGCLYVKADMSGDSIRYAQWGERNFLTQLKRSFLFDRLVQAVDIVSFETEATFRGVLTIPPEKKLLLPNGFDPGFSDWYGIRHKTFAEKENIILLVGRQGDYIKNFELMFDVLQDTGDIGDWQVWFVGCMTNEFKARRDAFLQRNPHLSDRVVFTGQIDDKRELFELYNRARILCLTSRWESWGMVCIEAMSFGCFPVMTAVTSAADITDNGKCGIIVESSEPQVWIARLREILFDADSMKRFSDASQQHFKKFDWKNILYDLDQKIRLTASGAPEDVEGAEK
jgi:glycosyltransferase involved in cell wall biosynthesis